MTEMTREDIIAMAREAGAMPYTNRHYPDRPAHAFGIEQLERFAALVAAAAKSEEREACAKAAQDFLTSGRSPLGRSVADHIHERLVNAGARAVGDRAYDRYEGETK